jgi:glycosyltransferase involved in cell wall biosynthesis
MKVLLLNTFDEWGGAAKAAFRLNRGMQGIGVDSRMLVQTKTSDARDVIGVQTPLARIGYGIRAQLDTLPVRLYPNRPVYNFTPAMMPDTLAGQVAGIDPDIVHLHWLAAGFMRVETLAKLKKPLVWTLHDSWAFTGGCHIPYECVRYREMCGACPVLGSGREVDLSRWTWRRKKGAWRDLKLAVVAPSRWLAGCAGASSIFRDVRVEVIPNGLDLTVYKPVDRRVARDLLGLSQDKKYILFGAMNSTSDPNKGFRLLLPALQKMSAEGWKEKAELMVFGSSEPAEMPQFGMKANYLGRLRDDLSIARLYSAADVFVAPSLLENLPNTVMESMACGTPCVGFSQGGMPDLIEHGRTGYLARPYEPDDLAQGIAWILEDEERRRELSAEARQKVEREFALENVARQYVRLYHELLMNSDHVE